MSKPDEYYSVAIARIADEHDRLLGDGKLSLAAALGRMTIFVSGRSQKGNSPQDYAEFIEEAERWQAALQAAGTYNAVQIIERATAADVASALRDPEVAGVTVIGHGTLVEYWTEGIGTVRWNQVADARDHLKQGDFLQATCGHVPRLVEYAIPLGIAAVARYSNLRAAPGAILPDYPVSYDGLLVPFLNDDTPIAEQLAALSNQVVGTKVILGADGSVLDTKPC